MHNKLMALSLTLLAALALIVGAAAQTAEQIFTGTWIVKSGEYKGKPYDARAGQKFTFTNGHVSLAEKNGKVENGIFKVDITRKPQAIDIVCGAGKHKVFGVYDFSGNILRICYSHDSATRPTEVRTEPDKEWTLLIMSRLNQ
jgi:uncharacterized protein (TIGR03067 family)